MSLRPTFYDFSLNDGQVVQVTRNYAGLYMLKAYDPDLYEKSQTYNRKGKKEGRDYAPDDLDNAAVIYAAYVTATLVNNSIKKERGEPEDPIIGEVEFLALMPTNGAAVGNILKKLFGDEKKKADSKRHFEELQHKKQGGQ